MGKNLLFGVKESGKSSLIFNSLKELKRESFLYLNLKDFRIKKNSSDIELFLKKNSEITLVVLDNYEFDFELFEFKNILITTNLYKTIDGFNHLELYPLDFEEYLSFDIKHQDAIISFNNYLKDGTFPRVIFAQNHEKIETLQQILLNFVKNVLEFEILKSAITLATNPISLYQVYNLTKKEIKISKDKFYEIINNFIENKILFFVQKYNEPNSAKKLYLIDFKLKSAISFKKEFNREFENMVFLKLLKRKKEFFYINEIEFIIPKENLAISTALFFDYEAFVTRFRNLKRVLKRVGIKNLLIITVSSEYKIEEEGLIAKALPFWIWAIED
jgi:hypothetical protein